MSGGTLFLGVSLLFGCVTLVMGFVVGLWFAAPSKPNAGESSPTETSEASVVVAAQQVRRVSSSLSRLVHDLASDVTAHSTKIEAISAELRAADQALQQTRQVAGTAPDRILAANLELQEQLAKAKRQIELQAAQLRARESEARTDSLTSLFNRRAFEEELNRQLGLWDRNQISFALLMLDVDRFKPLNDLHGHLAGDEVLQEIARVIVGQLRGMDIAFRYGGEEFAVILPMTKPDDAGIIAERIRAAVEQTVVTIADKRLRVATSVGVAHAIAPDEAAQMVQRADEALYKAKQSGRNCVRWHNGKDIVALNAGDKSVAAKCATSKARQSSIRTSLTALNREVTKQVCNSRRCGASLSLVCLRIDSGATSDGDAESTTGDRLVPDVIGSLRPRLQETDFVAPTGDAEFVVVLPGRSHAAAMQLIADIICSSENDGPDSLLSSLLDYEICELLPSETAEQLIARTRESVLSASDT